MKALITGFDPFGGADVNPALEVVKRLEGVRVGDVEIVTREIPTVRGKAIEALVKAIQEEQPSLVIAVGQAGGCQFAGGGDMPAVFGLRRAAG